jgi:two-component system NarL family sensor kinase
MGKSGVSAWFLSRGISWGLCLSSLLAVITRIEWPRIPASWKADEFWTNYGWLVTTSLAMILCYLFDNPNAGVFLLIAVVHSVFAGGWKTGLASATLAVIYSAIFLFAASSDELFQTHARGLIGIALACYGAVLLVTWMRSRDLRQAESAAVRIRNADIRAESEALFRNIADGAPVLLWMADPSGKRYYFNQPWLSFTGKTLAEHADQGWHKCIHEHDRADALHRYAAAVKGCERYEAEYRLTAADGEYRWIQDFGVPRLGRNGEFLGYIGSCLDRTERKRVEHALHQLSGKLLELQDDERRRISRELHDTTAQNLAVLSMNMCIVKDAARLLNAPAREAVAECLSLAERCSQEIRTLSYILHPPLLDELGLMSALRAYTTGFTKRTGVQVELKMADIGRLPSDVETTLFRIVQEALTNVHRHSGSARADIRLIRDPKEVKLQVSDDGQGVPPASLAMISDGGNVGVGIAGMRERAAQLGGILKIASSERGTTVTAILPWRDRE